MIWYMRYVLSDHKKQITSCLITRNRPVRSRSGIFVSLFSLKKSQVGYAEKFTGYLFATLLSRDHCCSTHVESGSLRSPPYLVSPRFDYLLPILLYLFLPIWLFTQKYYIATDVGLIIK